MSKPGGKPEESSLKDRLSRFFRISKQNQVHNVQYRPDTKEIIFTPELLKEIGKESSLSNRISTIKSLNDIVSTKRLEQNATEHLWVTVSDLMKESSPEPRQVLLKFMECLIKGQFDQLELGRAVFFEVLVKDDYVEDLPYLLGVFRALTDEGRDLTYFEERAGALLVKWGHRVLQEGIVSDYMSVINNIIKHNAAYLDQHVIVQIVNFVSFYTNHIRSYEDMEMCLGILDAIVCYSYLPSEALFVFVVTICRMLNIERFSSRSLKLMRNLLGTHLGHGAIRTMCMILQDRAYEQDPKLLRGAVYFIGMALWGSRFIPTLMHPPSSVLPSFLAALENSGSNIVAHEIVFSLFRLMNKHGDEQHMVTCEIVLEIIVALLNQFKNHKPDSVVSAQFHELLSTIQELCEKDKFQGDKHKFYSIIEKCADDRPEKSVVGLLLYKGNAINPLELNWIQNLIGIMDHYYRYEKRTLIRKEALAILARVIRENRHTYGEDLIENVVLIQLKWMDNDTNVEVRCEAIKLLIELAKTCQGQQCSEILTILKKAVKRPLSTHTGTLTDESQAPAVLTLDDRAHADIEMASLGIVCIFETKLYHLPSSDCLKAFAILLSILRAHYAARYLTATACKIRAAIFQCLISLRADPLTRLGLPRQDHRYYYSPYILCRTSTIENVEKRISVTSPPQFIAPSHSPHLRTSILNFQDAFNAILVCLEKELDWPVLKLVLEDLPNLLQNKTLVLSAHTCVERLTQRLYSLVSDRKLEVFENLSRKPSDLTRSQFHACILPILASLASYHLYLDKPRQKELLYSLDFGLISKCSKVCVSALTVCMLEMEEGMVSQLPSTLQRLSQITATTAVAGPILEFLSSLIRLPKLYGNFVPKQYISVFAIALPYTDPFKFSHYTVSLAHHVIAMWFIKCRLPIRKDFVSYINRGLKGNVLRQFEEASKINLQIMNQDSSDYRRRFRSFGESTITRPKRVARGNTSLAGPFAEADVRTLTSNLVPEPSLAKPSAAQPSSVTLEEDGALFHRELTETCVDMMARYTYSSCSTMPRRSPVAEFLMKGGQSRSWIVGNKIITITVSGGLGRANIGGLCDKCFSLCAGQQKKQHGNSPKQSMASKRRRHKSAAVASISNAPSQKPTSQDDIRVYRQSPLDEEFREETDGVRASASHSSIDSGEHPAADVLLGLRARGLDRREPCSCWCNGWAEVYIRRPTGNVSWIMRIQNEQLVPNTTDHFIFYDVSPLFRVGNIDTEDHDISGRIDSESLGENEYESLLEKHFPSPDDKHEHAEGAHEGETENFAEGIPDEASKVTSNSASTTDGATPVTESTVAKTPVKTESLAIPSPRSEGDSPSLRKSQSSPDFSADVEKFIENNKSVDEKDSTADDITSEVKFTDRTTSDPGPERSNSPFLDIGKLLEEKKDEEVNQEKDDQVNDLPAPFNKVRSHTVAVMGPTGRVKPDKETVRGSVTPSFVFLQLYHSPMLNFGEEKPILLPQDEVTERSLKVLDLIPPYETHKIGVVYVGDGQAEDQSAILGNVYGSSRYADFLHGLGDLIKLTECNPEQCYVGGLDTSGEDGQFAYSWRDDVMQVIFHVATLMPTKETDPKCNAKKLHIGNDYVTIVYNNSNENYKIGTIKGQFNYVNIVITPLDHTSNSVTIQCKPEIVSMLGQADIKVVGDSNLAILVRQIAVHSNLASLILQRQKTQPKDPYASNWLERLRQIKRTQKKALTAMTQQTGKSSHSTDDKNHPSDDFMDYSEK